MTTRDGARRLNALLVIAVLAGCAGAQQAQPAARSGALTEEEFALACAHDPRSRLRLYGCGRGPATGPLIIVDGTIVSIDTSDAWRAQRDSVFASLRSRIIDSVQYLQPDSGSTRFGSRARGGVLLIWTRRP